MKPFVVTNIVGMMTNSNHCCFTIEVSGKNALFTRPEFKVERMSYEVITPSAARAIFEAIYWKPAVKWTIKEISVINPISFAHFKRCETAAVAHTGKTEIIAEKCRQLRSSVVLRDVKYIINAELKLSEEWLLESEESIEKELAKHCAMFRRRAQRGQCFTQPYLGCREFSADWRYVTEAEKQQPINVTKDLGRMLYDMDFTDPKYPKPIFFNAQLTNGVIIIQSDNCRLI
ncbi:MAG: type I-C CRISPR-associated protein Cas5c [Rikenellaceae bacterium]